MKLSMLASLSVNISIGGPKISGNFVRERQRIVYIYNIHICICIHICILYERQRIVKEYCLHI